MKSRAWSSNYVESILTVAIGGMACLGCNGGSAGDGSESGGTMEGGSVDAGSIDGGSGSATTGESGEGTTSDAESGGTTGNDPQCPEPYNAGSVVSQTITPFPAGVELALEDYFSTHWLHGSPGSHAAQQMYVASCNADATSPTAFVSVSTGNFEDCEDEDGLDRYGRGGCGGLLIELAYEEDSGLGTTGTTAALDECIELYGVTASADCGTVAVLCRRENMATVDAAGEITKNSLVTHMDAEWMTHPLNVNGDGRRGDEIWLYEWPDGDISGTPDKYVVHRAIGTSYGKYSLLRGNDDTYGIGVRSDVFSEGGTMHSADAMLVLDAQTFDYTDRGYSWACGVGHTTTNFMAFNPVTQKYAMHCTTDYNGDEEPAGDSYIRLEDGGKDNDGDGIDNGYFRHHRWGGESLGGALMLQPLSDGGFIGTLVGIPSVTENHPEAFHQDPMPTSIGIARFGPDGSLAGEVHWVESDMDGLVSQAQLAPLGNGRFLFGWGTMHRFSSYPGGDRHIDYKVPHEHHVVEIDESGAVVSEQLDLPADVGWGEWNEMTPLGDGRVGWVHTMPATVTVEDATMNDLPLDRSSIVTHVYSTGCQ